MNTITGSSLLTINAEAGETYCIEYETGYNVNILNQSSDIISVSTQPSYAEDETSSECLVLTEDAFYYDLCSRLSKRLYITASGNGYVSVVRTDR